MNAHDARSPRWLGNPRHYQNEAQRLCAAAGHPDDEDCPEHDPTLRLVAAEAREQALRETVAGIEALADTWEREYDDSDLISLGTVVAVLRAALDGER